MAFAQAVPASARDAAPAFIPAGDVADAPSGFVEMCARDAALCRGGWDERASGRTLAAAVVVSEPNAELTLVKAINSQVNRAISPVDDYRAKGTSEFWSRPGRGSDLVGDCEDYAIEKRMRLVEAGFAADRLFYAAAYLKGYGMHVVLVARLSSGDMVLDSISPHVLPWSKVRYNWLRVQSTRDPLVWNRVGAPSSNRIAAAIGADVQS
ncbi:transglutaminase-like cysteine peptidase [Sphingobium sp. SCG-1]|uniref:transglutaminase-like cysteine peptidase n=1 Tax=Sphingobium sp. SCG-1 TaxID=2072936 RepID=UPI00166F7693|nr:transglutaminase-like cysteine peptidase [Sphingobium sp. SCG-1]